MSSANSKASRRRWLRRAALVGLVALALLIPLAVQLGRWLAYPHGLRQSDVMVVLGGRQTERMAHAIQFYRRGYAPQIWHTGDVPPVGARLSQAARSRGLAVERGVPREAITLLATRSTWEDGAMVASLARERGVRQLLLVTDWTHSRRAVCTLRRHLHGSGIVVHYAPPPWVRYTPDTWWYSGEGFRAMRREVPAVAYYWARYGVNPFNC